MSEEENVFVLCLSILRWSALTFTKIRMTEDDVVAENSKWHLVVNIGVACGFLFLLGQIPSGGPSRGVHPLYTKFMILSIVALCFCGNVYNKKVVGVLKLFLRVTRDLQSEFGGLRRGREGKGRRTLFLFFVYVAVTTLFAVWADAVVTARCERFFRVVHHFAFSYVTLTTAHFVVTLNYVEEKFEWANAAFEAMVEEEDGGARGRRRLAAWLEAFMEMRAAEELVNDVFGKQIFLALLLSFSSVVVNSYYFVVLNLHGSKCFWLRFTTWLGFFQSVLVALLSVRAAEKAAKQANNINELIFKFPLHLQNWKMHNRLKYFAIFIFNHPIEFKAWIFYVISYDSLFKVMITSTAVTAVILQCDFIKGTFDIS